MKDNSTDVARYLISAAACVVVIAGLKYAAPLIVPFLLSVFIAILCIPVMRYLNGHGIKSGLSLIVVVGLIFIVGSGVVTLIGGAVNDFSVNVPAYQDRITAINKKVIDMLSLNGVVVSKTTVAEYVDTSAIMGVASDLIAGFGNVLANSFLILITVVFILLESNRFDEKLKENVGEDTNRLYMAFSEKLRRYMGIKTWMSLATGLLVGFWLWLLGVDHPQLWGVLAFLLNYVPNIGSIIAAAPAVLLALVQFDIQIALLVIVGYVVINVVIGNIVEPKFLGEGLDLSALVVFLSLVFWGWVLGPVGMVLSVPLTISLKLALDVSPETKWLGAILGR